MKQKNQKKSAEQQSYNNYLINKPVFFSHSFNKFLSVTEYIAAFYCIFSTFIYFIVHFNGNSLFKSKSTALEFDNFLFSNLLINSSLILVIFLSYFSKELKSITLLGINLVLLVLIALFLVSPIQSKDIYLVNTIQAIKISLFLFAFSIIAYSIVKFFSNIVHMRNWLSNNVSVEDIIHEIKLRTDMMKFSYNNLLIRFRIHKLFPMLMYKKSDYYYLTCGDKSSKIEVNVENENFAKNTGIGFDYDNNDNDNSSDQVQTSTKWSQSKKLGGGLSSDNKNCYKSTIDNEY